MPVANNASALRQVLWLSLCTMAMAIRAQSPWSKRPAHLIVVTVDWLMTMRWRRASKADSSAVITSCCAVR